MNEEYIDTGFWALCGLFIVGFVVALCAWAVLKYTREFMVTIGIIAGVIIAFLLFIKLCELVGYVIHSWPPHRLKRWKDRLT